jgi:hypothetical protein
MLVFVVLALLVAFPAGAEAPPRHHVRRPVQVVKVVNRRSFSWRDAGIGATAAGLGIAVVSGSGLLLARVHRPRTSIK